MEAVIESLKDMELRHPQEGVQSNIDVASNDPSSEGMQASMSESNDLSPEGAGVTTSMCSKLEESATPQTNTIRPCAATESSSMKGSNSSENTCDSTRSSVYGSSSSQQGADAADGTRATLVIQKNPSSHVMEGLAHRWGLNFFKSNR